MPEQKRKRILIVLGFMEPSILAGFSRYAREAGWVVNAFAVYHGSVPKAWQADGLLTTNVFRPDLVKFVRGISRSVPTVLHGCNDLRLASPNVETDEREIGRMAARHLLKCEHRHFACLRYSRNIHALRRLEGFREVLGEAGQECIDLEMIAEHGVGVGEWFRHKLSELPKPLGLFAEDDLLAARVIEAANDAGWHVPEELAVIGCGNIELVCELGTMPITSIACPLEEQAYQAAAMLNALMNGEAPRERTVTLPPLTLIARKSTDSVVALHPLVKRAIDFMGKRLHHLDLDAPAVAAHCGVSLRGLYNGFQSDLRTTPMAFLQRLRLRRAMELLRQDHGKVEAIATACGFSNLRTFQRTFQRQEGTTPTLWKRGNEY
jgi:LacI family transcriptional regulator